MVVVDWVGERAAEARVQAGNAKTLEEDSEVTARAEWLDADIIADGISLEVLVHRKEVCVDVLAEERTLVATRVPESAGRVSRMLDSFGRVADEVRERWRARGIICTAGRGAIQVEVRDDMLLDPVGEVFAPLGAANEAILNKARDDEKRLV